MPSAVQNPEENSNLEPIAIVGMACRLPGSVNSPSKFWELLRDNRSVQTAKVPHNRFNIEAHYHPDLTRPGSFNSYGGYFLDGNLDDFDPSFFNMTPVEAMWLDPQQRKMLEVSYECLENAGLTLDDVSGTNTAVFVGCFTSDYQQMSIADPDFRHNYCATGVDVGVMSNRIGNTFNLTGPSFTINTACSSSIYAIHNACHALRAQDCVAAIAGGVNLILTVDQHMNTAKLGVLSKTSTCHTFDESADGYGRAEGAGALYLKRLSDAIRDGDAIRGVIRSSAVNTNGKVEGMGITSPSVNGQERAISSAYKRANLDPNRTAYFECHGTGTPVGDPIEVRAASNAMNQTRCRSKPLLLGAVKTNIGHSEAASGIFAIMKAAMVTESGIIPGVHGFKSLNPNIKDKEWNVEIVADLTAWPTGFEARRASVSSFGYGGTNGHVIIEAIESVCPWYEHGKPKAVAGYNYNAQRPFVIGMSAHNKKTLERNIKAHREIADLYYLPDLAYTLNSRRTRFAQRGFTIASEGQEMDSFNTDSFTYDTVGKPGGIGFVFTGQGAQWPRMGYEAIQTFPLFRKTIDALDQVLHSGAIVPRPSWTLRAVLEATKDTSRVHEPDISQPACTAVQIAIVDLLASWDIEPAVTIGHSSGEIGAAYAAGRLSAPAAIIAAYYRGFTVKKLAPIGAMLAIGAGASEANGYIPEPLRHDVTIACENSPNSVTLSGTVDGIAQVKARCDELGVFARELRTGKAYHSAHMDNLAPAYESLFSRAIESINDAHLCWRRVKTSMISSVTGVEYPDDDISISYFSANLRSRVLFDSALTILGSSENFSSVSQLIEIGPHSALSGPIKQVCSAKGFGHLGYIPSLIRQTDSAIAILKVTGELFNRGTVDIDFALVNQVERLKTPHGHKEQDMPRYLPDLPPYQWNYEHTLWYEPRLVQERRKYNYERHDILGRRIFGLADNSPAWKNTLRQRDVPWLKDHTLASAVVFPAAGHLSLAVEAYFQLLDVDREHMAGVEIRDLKIGKALIIPDTDDGIEIHTCLHRISEPQGRKVIYSFVVESIENGAWTTHSEGQILEINIEDDERQSVHQYKCPIKEDKLYQRSQARRWYDSFHQIGFKYGPSFQTLQSVCANGKDRVTAGNIRVQTGCGLMPQESRYLLHPSTIDGCLHLVISSIHRGLHKDMAWAVVPLEIELVSLYIPRADDLVEGHAVAWTDQQWSGRFFNHHTQLQGPSGKLLIDMKNIKSVIYDAAIVDNGLETSPRQAYARTSWKRFLPNTPVLETAPVSSDDALNNNSILIAFAPLINNEPLKFEPDTAYTTFTLSVEDASLCYAATHASHIVIDDRAGTLLSKMSKQSFENIKSILCSGKSIVWLTSGVNSGMTIGGGMAQGFLRVVRSEFIASRITLLDVDKDFLPLEITSTILDRLARNASKDSGQDVEFWLRRDGSLYIPRIVSHDALNKHFFQEREAVTTQLDTGKYFRGKLVDRQVTFDVCSSPECLGSNEVEIQVQFSELNSKDLKLHAKGPNVVVGRIVRVGASLESSLIGQEAIAYTTTPFETLIRSSTFVNTKVGGGGAIFASTLPSLCKAIDAVLETGNVKSGDHLLLLATAEPFVDIVTKLGKILGFQVTYSDGASNILKLLASPNSPSVVVACSSSSTNQRVWRHMSPGSRLVLVDTPVDWPLSPKPFSHGVSLMPCGISRLVKQDPAKIQRILKTAIQLMELNGELTYKPRLVDAEALQDIATIAAEDEAFEHGVLHYIYGENKVMSKVPQKQITFSSTGAYLLVGCLGGLGRSLTPWMFERGCRNFAFLSRSGADKPEASAVVSQLRRAGATVHIFRADVSDEEAVATAVSSLKATMPIKGVVHAAMVLQDSMFESLTYREYTASTNPKVNGALSLHKALSDTPLDFFLMTSSISAVLGNPGQSNYCAGNSYLDSLARHRRKLGLAASSIALPMVLDVGVVAENANIEVSLARKGMYGIDEREMLQAFEAGMLQGMSLQDGDAEPSDAQIILGLEPTSLATALTAAGTTDAYWINDSRLADIRTSVDELIASSDQDQRRAGGFIESLAGKTSEDAIHAVAEHIIEQCSKILMLPAEKFETAGSSIASYGVDSMIGVELRTWLYKELGLDIGFQALLRASMDFASLAEMVVANIA